MKIVEIKCEILCEFEGQLEKVKEIIKELADVKGLEKMEVEINE